MANTDNLSDFFQDLVDTIRAKIPNTSDVIKIADIEGIIRGYDVEAVGGFYEEVVCAVENGIRQVESVVVYNGVKGIESNAYQGMDSLAYVKMFDTVESIGAFAFGSCKSLKKVVLPKGLKTLWPNAFSQCTSIERVTFDNDESNGIEIGETCFSGCKNLQEVFFSRVKKISAKAFSGCTILNKVVILNQDNLPTLEAEALNSIPTTATFYVSEALFDDWKTELASYGITNVVVYNSNDSNDGNID